MVLKCQSRMSQFGAIQCLLIAWTSFWLTVCARAQSEIPDGPWGPGRFPPDENPQYFPPKVFGGSPAFDAKGYSWYLRSM